MKIITTKSGKLLIIEDCPGIHMLIKHTKSLKIVGKLSELKDEDVEEFIDRYTFNETGLSSANEMYKYYGQCIGFPIISAKESFLSLLASNGLSTNNKEYLIVKTL